MVREQGPVRVGVLQEPIPRTRKPFDRTQVWGGEVVVPLRWPLVVAGVAPLPPQMDSTAQVVVVVVVGVAAAAQAVVVFVVVVVAAAVARVVVMVVSVALVERQAHHHQK